MELLILTHFREASDFQTFTSLIDQEFPVFFFFRETKKLWFFEELVYIDHYENMYNLLESGIKIHGKNEGFWTEWYKNGKRQSEGSYRNGEPEGHWTHWYSNGVKWSEGSYRDGKEESFWKEWYNNGKKESEGSYQNGEREGPWISWYDNGEKRYERFYLNGRMIK